VLQIQNFNKGHDERVTGMVFAEVYNNRWLIFKEGITEEWAPKRPSFSIKREAREVVALTRFEDHRIFLFLAGSSTTLEAGVRRACTFASALLWNLFARFTEVAGKHMSHIGRVRPKLIGLCSSGA
jgi:hypothetical protein